MSATSGILLATSAKATDAIVIVALLLGVVVVVAGVASFNSRARARLPLPGTVRDRAVGRVALIVSGLVLITVALG